jgi:hypothetical protein
VPFYLKERDTSAELLNIRSVLIVPCRFCPAATFAVRENKPFIDVFRTFLRTAVYESYIRSLKERLENKRIRVNVFESRVPNQFIACMWTSGRRRKLKKLAVTYDAVIVLGCDAAVRTVEDSIGSASKVIPGMEIEGIMNVIPSVQFPFTIYLRMSGLIRVIRDPADIVS